MNTKIQDQSSSLRILSGNSPGHKGTGSVMSVYSLWKLTWTQRYKIIHVQVFSLGTHLDAEVQEQSSPVFYLETDKNSPGHKSLRSVMSRFLFGNTPKHKGTR